MTAIIKTSNLKKTRSLVRLMRKKGMESAKSVTSAKAFLARTGVYSKTGKLKAAYK